jgi:hypothetical protein
MKPRLAPTFRQLCVIAREQIQADPTMTDGEWAEAIKQRLIALRFEDNLHAYEFTKAIAAVEAALTKIWGPRPVDVPKPAATDWTPPQAPDATWKRNPRFSGWASLADLTANLQGFVASAPSSSALPEATARETRFVTEEGVLHAFYREVADPNADRLAIVRTYAEIAILRPTEWDPEQLRAEFEKYTRRPDGCFVCRTEGRERAVHHIVQLQHGGSNSRRNLVSLCDVCHHAVHPWLPPKTRRASAWSSLGDLAAEYAGKAPASDGPRGFQGMRKWQQARAAMRCGFEWEHRIAMDEWYLVIEVGVNVLMIRCRMCALERYGEALPEALAAQPPLEEPQS